MPQERRQNEAVGERFEMLTTRPTEPHRSAITTAAVVPASFEGGEIRGVVRLGRRTKELTQRLPPGAIAVIDHADLDSVAARSLLLCRPAAVLNCRPFVTGRYPNRGPGLLLDAGIPLFDLQDEGETAAKIDLFTALTEGDFVSLREAILRKADGTPVAALSPLTPDRLSQQIAASRANLDTELSSFVENTLRYLGRDEERALLLDPIMVPPVRTVIAGRPVLVVVRGDGYEDDLRRLAPYIRDQKPVVLAVDGAADTLLALGIRPHLILGDMDSVRDTTLRCGAELIVHAYARPCVTEDEAAPGLKRLRGLGLAAETFPIAGTSEDAALLLAYEKEADLIVAVGTHTHLEDFLDKGRGGMASTFLVRLKIGSRLVDARGVSRLYQGRQKMGGLLTFLAVSALFPVFVLLAGTPQGQVAWRSVVVMLRLLFHQ